MSKPYAEVIGDPIAHSKSPLIHNFWLDKLGIDAEYRACHVRPGELEDYFARRRGDEAWLGCNVTIPHKLAVLELIDQPDDAAQSTGAANTIYRTDVGLTATNTDIDGILAALPPELMPAGSEVCILGTGGAARAAFAACRRRDVSHVLLNGRNQTAAWNLHRQFGFGGSVKLLDDPHNLQTAEVIINATSLGMSGKDPMPVRVLDLVAASPMEPAVLDMVYSPLLTPFMEAAAAAGGHVVSGLEMLIGQAAAAFEHFFGVAAPCEFDEELRQLLTS